MPATRTAPSRPTRRRPREPSERSFRRVRAIGVGVIIGLVVFVTVVDALDGLFFGDHYHPDLTFLSFLLGMTTILLTGEAIDSVARRRDRDE